MVNKMLGQFNNRFKHEKSVYRNCPRESEWRSETGKKVSVLKVWTKLKTVHVFWTLDACDETYPFRNDWETIVQCSGDLLYLWYHIRFQYVNKKLLRPSWRSSVSLIPHKVPICK
jgi:hypothetical protein